MSNIENKDSETKVVEQSNPVNAADYICGLKWHSEQASNNYFVLDVEWHDDVVKLKHHKDKATHHLEKLEHHEELAAFYNCQLNLNDEMKAE